MAAAVRVRPWLAAVPALTAAAALWAAPASADAVRGNEWALGALQAPEAWSTSRGDGVTVAVLDTGVDGGHPDLTGQVTAGPDLVGSTARPGDPYWGQHGTAMASAIAGHGHGAGGADGVMGIAPGAKIMSVRVIPERNDPGVPRGRGTGASGDDSLVQGIRYATDHGAQVISMSLGGTSLDPQRNAQDDEAVQYAIAHDVVVVASAGNGAETTNRTEFPAAYPGVIAVAAADRAGHRAPFSTHGWATSVAAPGVDILGARPGGGYLVGDGTSPAAAFVSGVCALIRARVPGLSPAQVRQVLERTAAGQPAGQYTEDLGWGLVQPAAALRLAATLKPQPPDPALATYRTRYYGDGRLPVIGFGWLYGQVLLGLAALPTGGACLVGAVLLAVRRRRGSPGAGAGAPLPAPPPGPAGDGPLTGPAPGLPAAPRPGQRGLGW